MARRSIADWYTPIRMPTLADAPPRQESLGDTIAEAIRYNKDSKRKDEELKMRRDELKMREDEAKLQKQKVEFELNQAKKEQAKKNEYDELMKDPMALTPAGPEEPGLLRKITDYAGITKAEPEPGPVSDDFRRMQALELTGQGEEAGKFRNQQINQFNALGGAATPEGRQYFNQVISGGNGSMQEPPKPYSFVNTDEGTMAIDPYSLDRKLIAKSVEKLTTLGLDAFERQPDGTMKKVATGSYPSGGGGGGGKGSGIAITRLALQGLKAQEANVDQANKQVISAQAALDALASKTIDPIKLLVESKIPVPGSITADQALAMATKVFSDKLTNAKLEAESAVKDYEQSAIEFQQEHPELGQSYLPRRLRGTGPVQPAPAGSPPPAIPNPIGGPSVPIPTTVPTSSPVSAAKDLLNRLRQGRGK